MPDHTDNTNLDKIVKLSLTIKTLKGGRGLVWDKPVLGLKLCFCPSFCNTLDYLLLLLAYTFGQDLWRIYNLGRKLVQCSRRHFTFTKYMNMLISTKNRFLYLWLNRAILAKRIWFMSGWKFEHFNPNLTKLFFLSTPQPLYDVMQKEIDNLEFVQGVHLEFINSSKNNGTNYLLIFDDSCAEICNSKAFVDLATASRHRGFSTIYFKHNLFHQSKLGRDVELQNKHIVLFKSPRDVHQVATLSVQLGLGSALVDWYRDATSVPFGHLLIDFSREQTIAYATAQIAELFHQSSMYPTTWSVWNIWTMISLYLSPLQAFQHFPLACKIQFLKTCPKKFSRFLSECIVNLLQLNLLEVKKSQVLKYRDEIHEMSLKRTTWKQRRSLLSSQKDFCS